MKEQNYSNHSRYVPAYHFATFGALFLMLAGAVINVFAVGRDNLLTALLLVLGTLIMTSLCWYLRAFPLKAQDRAIRAEENFRHYILSGKALPDSLRMSQIVALRFASDEELVELTERAVRENLTSRHIKQAIKNWRADHHRA